MERIEKLKELLMKSPEDSFLLHALALENIKEANDGEAKELFEKIVSADPGYVGSYYHLGKIYERQNDEEKAIGCYKKGMEMAKAAGETRMFNELQSAYEQLIF